MGENDKAAKILKTKEFAAFLIEIMNYLGSICAGFVYFTIVYVTYIYPSTNDYKIQLSDFFYTVRLLFDIIFL